MPLDFDDRPHAPAAAGIEDDAGRIDDADGRRVDGLTYRSFTSTDDAAACVALQAEIWGTAYADLVPAALLRVATHIGGLAIGAFDADRALVGFVFGLAGYRDDEAIHWSHMLAVREAARGAGVGRRLKEMQRAELARRGVGRVLWTFDPLQARNAHLNLNRLGVRIVDYVENMYGITQSPLHHGLATDRLVAELPTGPAPVGRPTAAHRTNGGLPILTPFPRAGDVTGRLYDAPPAALVEIPTDLQRVVTDAPDVAAAWRAATRAHLTQALRDGYEVTGLRRDQTADRSFYVLVKRLK